MSLTLQDVDKIIDNAKPELFRRLNLSTLLQAELRRVDVITESLQDELQAQLLTPHQKINILLDGLKSGPIGRFLTFCQTLHTEGQGHLLQIMGVDLSQIEAQTSTPRDDIEIKGLYQRLIHESLYQRLIHDRQDLSLPDPLTDRPKQEADQDHGDSKIKGEQQQQQPPGEAWATPASRPLPDIPTPATSGATSAQEGHTNSAQNKPPVKGLDKWLKNVKLYEGLEECQQYKVEVHDTEAAKRCHLKMNTPYDLHVHSEGLCLTEKNLSWNYSHIRRYGCGEDNFTFEAGRKSFSGEGLFSFLVPAQGEQLFRNVQNQMNQCLSKNHAKGRVNKCFIGGSESLSVPERNHLPEDAPEYKCQDTKPLTNAQSELANIASNTVHYMATDLIPGVTETRTSESAAKRPPIPKPRNLSIQPVPKRNASLISPIKSHLPNNMNKVSTGENYALAKCNLPSFELWESLATYAKASEKRELDPNYREVSLARDRNLWAERGVKRDTIDRSQPSPLYDTMADFEPEPAKMSAILVKLRTKSTVGTALPATDVQSDEDDHDHLRPVWL